MNKKSLVILISVIALLIVECIAFVCIKFSFKDGDDEDSKGEEGSLNSSAEGLLLNKT